MVSNNRSGAFLQVFRSKYPDIPITAFLRSSALDNALENLGNVTVVHGDFEEHDKLAELSASHSIIIDCAASFFPQVTEDILRGVRQTKFPKPPPILLHLSGTGNFVDGGKSGTFVPQERPFNDANPDQVRKIDSTYPPNGAADELILKAASDGIVNAFFVCPAGIYGTSVNHIGGTASASIFGVWVNRSISNVETLGFSPYIGPGTSVMRTVHVDDVVELMMLVFAKALATWQSYQPNDVYQNFYIAVDETHPTKPLAEAFAALLYRNKKIAEPIVKSVPFEEAGKVAV